MNVMENRRLILHNHIEMSMVNAQWVPRSLTLQQKQYASIVVSDLQAAINEHIVPIKTLD